MLYKRVFNWMGMCLSLTLMVCLCDLVTGYRLPIQPEVKKRSVNWDEFQRILEELLHRYENSIERFAQDEVCGTADGRIHFVNELDRILSDALNDHLSGRSADFFILEFVEDLCRPCEDCESQKHMLNNWVGLVYDFDNNQVIDNEERRRMTVNINFR